MSHTIAIAFIHGIGRTRPGYSARMQRALSRRFAWRSGRHGADPRTELVFEEVNWSRALQARENQLWKRMERGSPLAYTRLRHFMIDFAADAVAYQPGIHDRSAYDAVHGEVACALAGLAERAGGRAPLCIIAHSLGTVIASNYIYDLQKARGSFLGPGVRKMINGTPLERGETFALFYTLGSPIALWSLRYPGFGEPITFPCRKLAAHHPGLDPRWINCYDPDDVVGYPLRHLNARYRDAVTEDRAVHVGSIVTGWNPLSHLGYWSSRRIADAIGDDLIEAWRASTGLVLAPAMPPAAERRRRSNRERKTG